MEQIVLILKGWNLVLQFYKIVHYRLVLSKMQNTNFNSNVQV